MPIEISGTTGISGVDGSASAPALQGSDSNTGVSFGSDIVNINTGGSTKAIFSTGTELYHNSTKHFETQSNGIKLDSAGDTVLELHTSNGGAHNRINFSVNAGDNYGGIWYSAGYNQMEFRVNNAERLRINQNGHIMIRTTVTSPHNSNSANFNTDGYLTLNHVNTESSGRAYLAFNYNASEIGSVTQSGTSGVSYNTSSDYRLKENIVGISDGITRLKTLKPSKFNFKTEKDRTVDGFIAHEVTAVPEAVTGTKDAVDSDNNPIYQGIDQSKLVPLLTAALQEAVAKIEVLETKVAALEAG